MTKKASNLYPFLITILALALLLLPALAFGQTDLQYSPLLQTGLGNEGNFSEFINNLYFLSIGLAALLAVIKITIAGVKWMLSDVVTDKSQAKKDIQGSLVGLLVIISAVLVLNIINPKLTNIQFEPENLEPTELQFSYSGTTDIACATTEECDQLTRDCEAFGKGFTAENSEGQVTCKPPTGNGMLKCKVVEEGVRGTNQKTTYDCSVHEDGGSMYQKCSDLGGSLEERRGFSYSVIGVGNVKSKQSSLGSIPCYGID